VPLRIVDTRSGVGGTRLVANRTTTFAVAGRRGLPAALPAVIVNVFSAIAAAPGSITVFTCGTTPPATPTITFLTAELVNNRVAVATPQGTLCVRSTTATEVVIDVVAYQSETRSYGLRSSRPVRVLDPSAAGGGLRAGIERRVRVAGVNGLPSSLAAAEVTVTAISPAGTGSVIIAPCGSGAGIPAMVVRRGRTGSATALVPVGNSGSVCVTSTVAAGLAVDVQSVWAADGSALAPMAPVRVHGTPSSGVQAAAGTVIRVPVAGRGGVPSDARSALVTVTLDGATTATTATAWPCGGDRPPTALVSVAPGRSAAATAAYTLGSGAICVVTSAAARVAVDVVAVGR
jgi:hypothetical protein